MEFSNQKRKRKPHSVYVLKCPDTNKIKYVGCSINPKKRFYSHTSEPDMREFGIIKSLNYAKIGWITKLRANNKKPVLEILQTFDNKQDAVIYELHLINTIKDLFNIRKDA